MNFHRKFLALGLLLSLVLSFAPAAGAQLPVLASPAPFNVGLTFPAQTAGSASLGAFDSRGLHYFSLDWVVSGSPTCSVTLDGNSILGGSFSTGSIVSAQNCGSSGSITTSSVSVAMQAQVSYTISGSGSVTFTVKGYSVNPGGSGGSTTITANYEAGGNASNAAAAYFFSYNTLPNTGADRGAVWAAALAASVNGVNGFTVDARPEIAANIPVTTNALTGTTGGRLLLPPGTINVGVGQQMPANANGLHMIGEGNSGLTAIKACASGHNGCAADMTLNGAGAVTAVIGMGPTTPASGSDVVGSSFHGMQVDANGVQGVMGAAVTAGQEMTEFEHTNLRNSSLVQFDIGEGTNSVQNGVDLHDFYFIENPVQAVYNPCPTAVTQTISTISNTTGGVATVTLAGAPTPPLVQFGEVNITGQSNGATHGTVYNGLREIASVISTTSFTFNVASGGLADSATGNGTVQAGPLGIRYFTSPNGGGRPIWNGTIVAAGCNSSGTNPLSQFNISGGPLKARDMHIEDALYGVAIGVDGNTKDVTLDHVSPVTNVVNGVLISNQWTTTNVDINHLVTTQGGGTPNTNSLIDQINGNTLTPTNNGHLGHYWLDSAAYPFTTANPVAGSEVANGFDFYNGTFSIFNGGTATFSVTEAGVVSAAGSGTFSGGLTAVEKTGTTISPINLGQNASNQVWFQPPIPTFTGSDSTTGGSLNCGAPHYMQVVYNSALGSTIPGIEIANSSTYISPHNCTSGSTGSITINAITLPSGYTSWTMYEATSSGFEQIVAACTNIASGSGCTITTDGSGAAPPTVNTSILQPANVQATRCPPSVIPSMFGPDPSGNFETWAGADVTTNNGFTSGFWDVCIPTRFTDQKATPPGGNNAFVLIDHTFGVNTSITNQDRALWIGAQTPSYPSADTGSHYALEGLQSELDINAGSGFSLTGSVASEISDVSTNVTDNSTANYNTSAGLGVNSIRASTYISGSGFTANYAGVRANISVTAAANSIPSGTLAVPFRSTCASSSSQTSLGCYGFLHTFNGAASGAQAAFADNNTAPGAGLNWFALNVLPGLASLLNGPVTLSAILGNAPASLPVTASMNVSGSQTISQLTVPPPAAVGCAGGSSTYGYKLVGVDGNGGTVASTQATCTTGVNPLTSGNPATIDAPTTLLANLGGFTSIQVYRTAGPMALGLIGTMTCNAPTIVVGAISCTAFSDTGLSASGSVPTANTTGSFAVAGLVASSKGTNIASAATIAPIAQLTHITGTTQITTITVPFTGFTGCVRLIPDGLWTTATGGNIALATTAVVNKVLQECYDGTSWYPSY